MYKRFLNNNDYLSIVTEEALQQLIRGKEKRLEQAEGDAEESIIEYLTDNYEIEKELLIGKNLMPYNNQITYPVGAHFYHNGEICQAMRSINGVKSPTDIVYWKELVDYDEKKYEEAVPYSQVLNWNPGNIVKFANGYFECMEYNGIDFDNIRVPGINAWERLEVYGWEPNVPYNIWEVVLYEDKYYALLSTDDIDLTINPFDSDNWGLIGTYDKDYIYEFKNTEFVEYNGSVYYPIMNPSSDELQEGYNIRHNDPRNGNVKKHLLRLAIYELHKLISPNNISSARISDFEASMAWLRDANRCKINPSIPRKLDEDNKPVTEFAISTFMNDYDPYKNPWQI